VAATLPQPTNTPTMARFVGVGPHKCRIFIHLFVHYSLHSIVPLAFYYTISILTFGFHLIIFHFIHFSIISEFMIEY
jgi:hypothetical protein